MTTSDGTFEGTATYPGSNYIFCEKCQQLYPEGTKHECPSYTPPGSSVSGYTCPLCFQWVPAGTFHFCYNTQRPTIEQVMERLQEIENMLVRIKKALGIRE